MKSVFIKSNSTFFTIWSYLNKFSYSFHFILDQRQGNFNDEYNNRNGYGQKHYGDRTQSFNNSGKWYNEKRPNRRSEESRNYREQSAGHGSATASNNNKLKLNETNHEREFNSVDRDSNSSTEVNNSRRRPKVRNNATNHSGAFWTLKLLISSNCLSNLIYNYKHFYYSYKWIRTIITKVYIAKFRGQ